MRIDEILGRPILLLSPHPDDAVLSAGALVERANVEVWTVFSGVPDSPGPTGWDRASGYDDSRALMGDRLREDREALAGVKFTQLPHLERAYTTTRRRATDLVELDALINAWLDDHLDGTLALPVGTGVRVPEAWYQRARRALRRRPQQSARYGATPNVASVSPQDSGRAAASRVQQLIRRAMHFDYLRRRRRAQRAGMLANEDHLAVRDLGLRVATRRNSDVLLYEELPYLWSESGDAAALAAASASGRKADPFTMTPNIVDKHQRVMRYKTQLRVLDPEQRRLEDPNGLPIEERYWLLPPRTPKG